MPYLRERKDVLETFIFSKMWFLAQILPLTQGWGWPRGPPVLLELFFGPAGATSQEGVWRLGCLLCLYEGAGSAGQADVPTGGSGRDPGWASGLLARAGGGPLSSLVKLFSHGTVSQDGLAGARAAAIYSTFMDTPPPPP